MEAEIIVQHKWVKGKQRSSAQVSVKRWTSTLRLVTNNQAPYLSEGYVWTLIICKRQSWRASGRTRALSRPRGGWTLRKDATLVLFSAACAEAPAEALRLCQTLHFLDQLPPPPPTGWCRLTVFERALSRVTTWLLSAVLSRPSKHLSPVMQAEIIPVSHPRTKI